MSTNNRNEENLANNENSENWVNKYKISKLKLAVCISILFATFLLLAIGMNISTRHTKLMREKEILQKLADKQVEKLLELQAEYGSHVENLEKEKNVLNIENKELSAKLLEEQAKHDREMEQMEKEKDSLKRQMEKMEAAILKELQIAEQKMASVSEYARLIGVPNVTNLEGNYKREKMLELIQKGNSITPQIYIQRCQKLDDRGIIESIVDLLATAEEPEGMVGEVHIEHYFDWFIWPERAELTFKRKTPKVSITYNEATADPTPFTCAMAEYALANRGCHFEVLIYYLSEFEHFGKSFMKFVYRRLA